MSLTRRRGLWGKWLPQNNSAPAFHGPIHLPGEPAYDAHRATCDVPFSMTIDGSAEAAAPLARHATGGSFLNFLQDTSKTHTAHTAADHRRLREVKRAHDPDNIFAAAHNIPPAAAASYASAQGTSTESSVGESRATTYSAASASDRF